MPRPVLVAAATLTLTALSHAQLTNTTLFKHTDSIAGLGESIRSLGDVNADGYDDYAIGHNARLYVTAISGRNGTELWRVTDTVAGFATRMARVPDADSDGLQDLLVSAPNFATDTGRVTLLSARTGAVIAQMSVGNPGDLFGFSMSGVDDVDGDGISDYIIGAPGYPNGAGWGRAVVISGANYTTVLADHQGFTAGRGLGGAVIGAGDIDHDGRGDYLIGEAGAGLQGQVRAYSGRFRILLYTLAQGGAREAFGYVITRPGDLDGDGDQDVLVSADPGNGAFYAFDLGTGVLLYSVQGGGGANLGVILNGVGDVDHDGADDFVAGEPYHNVVEFFSGRTGTRIYSFGSPAPGRDIHFGASVDMADVDGDGQTDLLVGQTGYQAQGNGIGVAAWSFALRPWPLTATGHTVSIGTGGRVNLNLDAGVSNAGNFYCYLGTASGPRPGFDLLGQHFPLNPDPFLLLLVGNLNLPILPTQLGVVDATGQASCAFQLIPGLSSELVGITFDFAAAVFCTARFDCLTMVSNARPVTLLQ